MAGPSPSAAAAKRCAQTIDEPRKDSLDEANTRKRKLRAMSRETHGAPLVRCLAVWSLTTATALVVLRSLGPELDAARALANRVTRSGVPFDSLLVSAAAVALCACTLWLWTVTTLVVVQATTGRLRSLRGCPDGVRRLVLAACGLALVATAAPAAADSTAGRPPAPDDRHAVSGLPLRSEERRV